MGALPPVVATFLADSKGYTAGVDKMIAKNEELGRSTKTMGSKFSSFASSASTGIIGVAAVGAVAAVKMAGNYQMLITQLVTGAGEAQKNIGLVSKGILAMAGAVGQTPAELAKGMYLIESAGFHGAAGLQVLKASAEGAAVGNADMATVANAVTTALHDYHMKASQAAAATSALVDTVGRGKTNLTDLATSLGKSMPVAAALGISFQQVTGAIAAMTNAGMSARFASTHLQTTLLALSAPSKVATKAMGLIGVNSQQLKDVLASPKGGLSAAIKLVSDQIGKTFPANSIAAVTAFKDIMGGATGYATALMLGGKNTQAFNANVKSIGDTLNRATPQVKGFSLVQKDLNFQLQKLKGVGTSDLINVGQWLLPKATEVAKWALNASNYMRKHPLVSKIAGDAAIGVFAASVAYKLGKAIGSVFSSVKSIFTGSALTGNTTALEENTAALSRMTGVAGGGLGAGGAAGVGAGAAGETAAGIAGGTLSAAAMVVAEAAAIYIVNKYWGGKAPPVTTGYSGLAGRAGADPGLVFKPKPSGAGVQHHRPTLTRKTVTVRVSH